MKHKYLVLIAALIFTMLCTGCQGKETTTNVPDTNVSDTDVHEEESKGEIATEQDDTVDTGAYSPEIPDYFQEVLRNIEKSRKEERTLEWEKRDLGLSKYNEYTSRFDEETQCIYNIKMLELPSGKVIEDAYFDLNMYQEGFSKWFESKIFYEESFDTVYLIFLLSSDPINYETNSMFMIVEFQAETPQDYAVTVFYSDRCSAGFAGFYWGYRIDNVFYQQTSPTDTWAIDLTTKKIHYCGAQLEAAKEVTSDYVEKYEEEGRHVSLQHFGALTKVDDVVIFVGLVSEASDFPADMPLLKSIYLAYRGDELLGAMVIDERTGEVEIRQSMPGHQANQQ